MSNFNSRVKQLLLLALLLALIITIFIALRAFIPGMDLYANPGMACTDFRGSTILPGIGHWVQQEAPSETNAALQAFLGGL